MGYARAGGRRPEMHRWVDHTADLALEVRAGGVMDLLGEALAALAGAWGVSAGPLEEGELSLEAGTLEELLVGLLNEAIFLAEVQRRCPHPESVAGRGRLESGPGGGLRLTVPWGPLLASLPPNTAVHVKAATFHGLDVRATAGELSALVVLDA